MADANHAERSKLVQKQKQQRAELEKKVKKSKGAMKEAAQKELEEMESKHEARTQTSRLPTLNTAGELRTSGVVRGVGRGGSHGQASGGRGSHISASTLWRDGHRMATMLGSSQDSLVLRSAFSGTQIRIGVSPPGEG